MSDLTPNPANTQTRSQQDVPAVRVILPEGEAILQPPMDNTPNSLPDEPPTRIPNLAHALLFLAIAGFILFLTQLIPFGLTHATVAAAKNSISPKLLIASEAVSYILTLAVSWFLFPLLWKRSFPTGIEANPDAARRNALRLIPIGLVLSFAVQAISTLISMPKEIPMDDFFRTPSDVWLVTAFGTLLAPMFEEICFRGFLLPAFAIGYDWLSLPRNPAAHERWRITTGLTTAALIFSAILSSIFFALLHAEQLAHAWAALFVLFCVSLILTLVRIRTQSVASSILVHASYNLSVFLTLFLATGGYRHLERMAR